MHNDLRIQRECLDLIFKYGWTSVEVQNYKQIKSSTIRNWKRHFQLFGVSPAQSRRDRARMGSRVVGRKVTVDIRNELLSIVKLKPWLYLDEFQEELQNRTGTTLSTSTIYKVLTKDIKWSLQIADESAREKNEIDRAEHLATLYEITTDPSQFVFVDETSKDGKVHLRKRLWQPINGHTPISRYFADHAQYCYTMIGACDIEGFIPEACELIKRKRNNNDVDEEAGTIDSERFVQWIENKLVPTLGNYYLGERRSIVVMDNATIHSDRRVLELILQTGALLIYQSPYSPDLNPIEFCFGQYKKWLRRHGREYGTNSFLAHFHALNSVKPENMRAYYRAVGGIQRVPNENTNLASPPMDIAATIACGTLVQNNAMLYTLQNK